MEPSLPENSEVRVPQPGDGPADPQPASTAGHQQDPGVRPKRRLRQVLVVSLAVAALLGLGGGAALFVFYDKATAPDLSTPELVTRKYLAAYLQDRDDVKAAQFQCADSSGLSDVRALRADIDARQKTFKVGIDVSVDRVTETSRSGASATTAAKLVMSIVVQGQRQYEREQWVFALKNENGWRVCSGHEQT